MEATDTTHSALSRLNRVRVADKGAGDLLQDAAKTIMSHDLPGLAADITYHATLAMLPFMLLLVSLPSVTGSIFSLSDPGTQVANKVGEVFTDDVGNSIRTLLSEVEESRGWSAFALGLTGSLWAGTSTVSTIRKALNRIHDCEEDTAFWRKKATELTLTIVSGLIAISAVIAAVAGPSLLGLTGWWSQGLFIVYALAAALALAGVLYWAAPAGESTMRWVTPGAVLFVVVWLAFSLGFSLYVANFSNMNNVYGTLGIMAIVIIWLYWSSLALLVGAEINALLTNHTDERTNGAMERM